MKKVYFVFYSVHDAEFGERTIADMYATLKNICINTFKLK